VLEYMLKHVQPQFVVALIARRLPVHNHCHDEEALSKEFALQLRGLALLVERKVHTRAIRISCMLFHKFRATLGQTQQTLRHFFATSKALVTERAIEAR